MNTTETRAVGPCLPVYFSSIEGFSVESNGGRVATLGTVDGDLSPKFHPWHSEDGAGISTW